MGEYVPIFTESENAKVESLMKELKKIQDQEAKITRELRKLIYKTETTR